MGTPLVHAMNSVKQFGGEPKDYLKIHTLMDKSKDHFPADHRHRVVTHNMFFVGEFLPMIFGETIVNSDGVEVSVREIGIWHLKDDFGGEIPSLTQWCESMRLYPWMSGLEEPNPPKGRRAKSLEEIFGLSNNPRDRRVD